MAITFDCLALGGQLIPVSLFGSGRAAPEWPDRRVCTVLRVVGLARRSVAASARGAGGSPQRMFLVPALPSALAAFVTVRRLLERSGAAAALCGYVDDHGEARTAALVPEGRLLGLYLERGAEASSLVDGLRAEEDRQRMASLTEPELDPREVERLAGRLHAHPSAA